MQVCACVHASVYIHIGGHKTIFGIIPQVIPFLSLRWGFCESGSLPTSVNWPVNKAPLCLHITSKRYHSRYFLDMYSVA